MAGGRGLVGVGWYRRRLRLPKAWQGRCLTLEIGGVAQEAWVWLNGQLVGEHLGHSAPFQVFLDAAAGPGEENELVIAVSNLRGDRSGCALRGYAGRSAGITRSVRLHVSRALRVTSLYLRPLGGLRRIGWTMEVAGRNGEPPRDGYTVSWRICERASGRPVASGRAVPQMRKARATWTTSARGLKAWSDRSRELYRVAVRVKREGQVLDEIEQDFGLRRIRRQGAALRLNGKPLYLRGDTEKSPTGASGTACWLWGCALGDNLMRFATGTCKELMITWQRLSEIASP